MRNIPFILSFVFLSQLHARQATLVVGSVAPDFALPYATRDSIAKTPLKLSEIIGTQNIILAFYPADWSSGCTKEVCTFRDSFSGLQALNAEILGISGDYVWSHHAWAQHHDLPFRLLSDHRHDVARAYQSFNEETNYTRRAVVVIDRKGKIGYLDMEYSVADSVDFERLKKALGSLR